MWFRQFWKLLPGLFLLLPACAHKANSIEDTLTKSQSANHAKAGSHADKSVAVLSPKIGLIRPGGPVNRPVPGTGTPDWKPLTSAQIKGEWTLKASDGLLCQLVFSTSDAFDGGEVTAKGACPDKVKRSITWRFFANLNQLALIDSQGGLIGQFRRISETRFMIYEAGSGSLMLERY